MGARGFKAKKKKRIGPIAYVDTDLKAMYLYNATPTMPYNVSKWESFLTGHLSLQISLPLF